MDISDEIVFPIYDEMHLNHGKLEIKCTGNWPNLIVADGMVFTPMCTYGASNSKPYCDEHAKTEIQGWDRRDTSSCVETRDFTYIPFFLINYLIKDLVQVFDLQLSYLNFYVFSIIFLIKSLIYCYLSCFSSCSSSVITIYEMINAIIYDIT